jgi:hypothetical protein
VRAARQFTKLLPEFGACAQRVSERHDVQSALIVISLGSNNEPHQPPIRKHHAGARHPAPPGLCTRGRRFNIERQPPSRQLALRVERRLALTGWKHRPDRSPRRPVPAKWWWSGSG